MVEHIDKLKKKSISLPITQAAIRIANQFANQQPTQSKKQQVYYNTLAVCVVNDYMRMMQIPTDLNASNSWNPVLRLCGDVADLMLSELGHLECRPIKSNELTTLPHIPPEIPDDRIGLIVVGIDVMKQEANLLGFARTVETGALASSHLQTMDKLFEYIEYLENLSVVPAKPTKRVVCLSQWFQNVFEVDWQAVSALLNPTGANRSFGVRGASFSDESSQADPAISVSRAKQIDLGMQLAGHSLALIVTIVPRTGGETSVRLRFRPTVRQFRLPAGVQMTVFDESGTTWPEWSVQARHADNCIQLEFTGEPGEHFSVNLAFGDNSITEYFVI